MSAQKDNAQVQQERQAEADLKSAEAAIPEHPRPTRDASGVTEAQAPQQVETRPEEEAQAISVQQWQHHSGHPAHYVHAFVRWAHNEMPAKLQSAKAWHEAHEKFRSQVI